MRQRLNVWSITGRCSQRPSGSCQCWIYSLLCRHELKGGMGCLDWPWSWPAWHAHYTLSFCFLRLFYPLPSFKIFCCSFRLGIFWRLRPTSHLTRHFLCVFKRIGISCGTVRNHRRFEDCVIVWCLLVGGTVSWRLLSSFGAYGWPCRGCSSLCLLGLLVSA